MNKHWRTTQMSINFIIYLHQQYAKNCTHDCFYMACLYITRINHVIVSMKANHELRPFVNLIFHHAEYHKYNEYNYLIY